MFGMDADLPTQRDGQQPSMRLELAKNNPLPFSFSKEKTIAMNFSGWLWGMKSLPKRITGNGEELHPKLTHEYGALMSKPTLRYANLLCQCDIIHILCCSGHCDDITSGGECTKQVGLHH